MGWTKTTALASIAVMTVSAFPVAAQASSGTAHSKHRVVATFDAARGENPENILVDRDGTIYLTMLFAHSVVRITPDGRRTSVVLPGDRALGIARDPRTGALNVAVKRDEPAEAAIWTVPENAFHSTGKPVRSVVLPSTALPNSIAYDKKGTLYAADIQGSVWRVEPGQREVRKPWLTHPLLEPTGEMYAGAPMPGANGLKIRGSAVYVANTARGTLVRVPVANDRPGTPKIVHRNLRTIDDFAFDEEGNVYAALNTVDRVVRVAPTGRVTTLLTHASAGLQNPTSVALSDPRHGRTRLYVNSSAFAAKDPHPALLELRLSTWPATTVDTTSRWAHNRAA
ncbi:SMP-30/gluconolactonase/LRE family protein [Micromonospora profundi]|uniref:SMP-30/gluconolactonase/LRE family protein n=1 Tax=Micromonospora profundi TaxID=1420889 RepID=A0AAJ6L3S2_9ACTN|nr:SMP-30/gluconolactonase/LRE family protein [Micromonospora profundi]WLS46616.1 SMP-30/gluconolactonase/LRE family protein [Micromonospora profundi]